MLVFGWLVGCSGGVNGKQALRFWCRTVTYGKKEYIPVYLVSTRAYIWVDAQNICSITEAPEPLLSGTHNEWRKLVTDTEAPRRRMFLTLGWEMLDISDRLHIMVSF